MGIKHRTIPLKTDLPGFTGVKPSNWAEDHTIDGDVDFQGHSILNCPSAGGTQVITDRPALRASNVVGSQAFVYVACYDSSKNAYNNASAAPHVTGHWMRQRTISAFGTNAARLALPWGDPQSGQFFVQNDVTPHLVWWWLSDIAAGSGSSNWYKAGSVGYAWDTSNNGTVYWWIDEIEPNAIQIGALNQTNADFSQDDTIPLQDLAYLFEIGRNVFLPCGWYQTTAPIALSTIHANRFRGEGGGFYGTQIFGGTGDVIQITGGTIGATSFNGNLEDFDVDAQNSGANGISSQSGVLISNCTWKRVSSIGGTGHGFSIPSHFSHLFVDCYGDSRVSGCGYALGGAVGTTLIRCDGAASGTLTAVFRIGDTASFFGCNPVFQATSSGQFADYGYLLGMMTSVSSTAQAGAASTITLNAGSTFSTDQIVAFDIVLTAGTGSGQTRRCTAYNSGTKVATVTPNWSVNPAAGTSYTIQDPVSFMRASVVEPTIGIFGGNIEEWRKDAVRTIGDTNLTMVGNRFTNQNHTYDASIRIAPNTGSSNITLWGNRLFATGASAAEILSEGVPAMVPGSSVQYLNTLTGNVEYLGVAQSGTVANLPAAASVPVGTRSFVTNATATTYNSIVAGGGANKVPVVSDGTNWRIG